MKDYFSKIKYPKFLLLSFTIFIAIMIFSFSGAFTPMFDFLLSLGFFGIFLTGMFYSYSFTAIPATAVLIVLSQNENGLAPGRRRMSKYRMSRQFQSSNPENIDSLREFEKMGVCPRND